MTALTPRPGIMKIAPYVPGKDSVDGKATIAKLSSNEGALGPSPKAMAAYAKAAAELHRYPDGASDKLCTAIGRHYGVGDADQLDRIVAAAVLRACFESLLRVEERHQGAEQPRRLGCIYAPLVMSGACNGQPVPDRPAG